jgi:hypothetical protein
MQIELITLLFIVDMQEMDGSEVFKTNFWSACYGPHKRIFCPASFTYPFLSKDPSFCLHGFLLVKIPS